MHQSNMWMFQGEIELPGTIAVRAGQVFALGNDWGFFAAAGNYFIQEAEQIFSARNGYVTKLTVRTAGPGSTVTPGGVASGAITSGRRRLQHLSGTD
jgi:hypothetical protein